MRCDAHGSPNNARAFGAKVEVRGAAPEAFEDAELTEGGVTGVPRPSAIFIGGGLTQPGLFDACLGRTAQSGDDWSPTRHR